MFVITTDVQENASHKYTSEQVKKMIEHRREKYGWEFLFIGANIDAVETAARYHPLTIGDSLKTSVNRYYS